MLEVFPFLKSCRRTEQRKCVKTPPPTRVSPPDAPQKGLLGERATGCWELELNGLGKSETHREKERGGGVIHSVWWHIPVYSNCSEAHTCILIMGLSPSF